MMSNRQSIWFKSHLLLSFIEPNNKPEFFRVGDNSIYLAVGKIFLRIY